MPWPVYLAFKQLFPSGRRVPFFTLISVAGVALGVALMLVTMSVMGGFGHQIKKMIIDTQGEVQVKARVLLDRGNAVEIEKILRASPDIQAFAPYASGMVMLEYQSRPAFPAIQGFNYEEMNSSRTQQFAERSLLNSYYSTKFVQGVLLGWLAGDSRPCST